MLSLTEGYYEMTNSVKNFKNTSVVKTPITAYKIIEQWVGRIISL